MPQLNVQLDSHRDKIVQELQVAHKIAKRSDVVRFLIDQTELPKLSSVHEIEKLTAQLQQHQEAAEAELQLLTQQLHERQAAELEAARIAAKSELQQLHERLAQQHLVAKAKIEAELQQLNERFEGSFEQWLHNVSSPFDITALQLVQNFGILAIENAWGELCFGDNIPAAIASIAQSARFSHSNDKIAAIAFGRHLSIAGRIDISSMYTTVEGERHPQTVGSLKSCDMMQTLLIAHSYDSKMQSDILGQLLGLVNDPADVATAIARLADRELRSRTLRRLTSLERVASSSAVADRIAEVAAMRAEAEEARRLGL